MRIYKIKISFSNLTLHLSSNHVHFINQKVTNFNRFLTNKNTETTETLRENNFNLFYAAECVVVGRFVFIYKNTTPKTNAYQNLSLETKPAAD